MCYGQDCQWDIYSPEKYTPDKYVPLTTDRPKTIPPYKAKNVTGTLDELKEFIHLSNQNSSIKESFLLDYSRYIDIAAKSSVKGTSPSWKNKELNAFIKDYRLLEYYVYRRDSINSVNERTKFVKDSLKKRALFYSDSLEKRMTFYQDSLKCREQFVNDSLYRAEYRKKNKYDKVEWSAPHGVPILCYRNGKLIDGKLLDDKGRLLKEWKDGKLIHDYTFSTDDYCIEIGKVCLSRTDKVEWTKEFFKHWSDMDQGRFIEKKYYDFEGREIRSITSGGSHEIDYYSSGEKKMERVRDKDGQIIKEFSYYPSGGEKTWNWTDYKGDRHMGSRTYSSDGKSIRTSTIYPSDTNECVSRTIDEYYSNGSLSKSSEYQSYNHGKTFVLRTLRKYDGTGWVDEYNFDRNGKFEYGVRRLDY